MLIEGRLKLDAWETDGQKRSKLRVIGERMQMLGGRGSGGGGGGGGGAAVDPAPRTGGGYSISPARRQDSDATALAPNPSGDDIPVLNGIRRPS